LSLDSAGYAKFNNATRYAVSNTTSAAVYTVDFNSTDCQIVSLSAATTFSLANVTLTNQKQSVDLTLYPGPSSWPITFPTNILWLSESGTNAAPTNIAGSFVMNVNLRAVYGSTTNVFGRVLLAPYSPSYDTNASNFFIASGLTNTTSKAAINQLILSMRSDGTWAKMDAVYPFVGSTSNLNSWNLIDTNKFRVAWSGGVVHDTNGITGNGSTALGDTGFNPATATTPKFTLNSASVGVYTKNAAPAGGVNQSFMGGASSGNFAEVSYNGSTFDFANGPNTGSVQQLTPVNGVMISTRTASNVQIFYNKTSTNGGSATSAAVPNANIYLLAENDVGVGTIFFSNGTISFAFIGGGLSAGDEANLAADILAYETTMGRQ
jgi:hypothetical protein